MPSGEQIVIDDEFRSLIPPLSAEEREQLELNIVADGCREPLVVWHRLIDPPKKCKCKDCCEYVEPQPGGGVWSCGKCGYGVAPYEYQSVLIDGHNRFEICNRRGIEFSTVLAEFEDRTEAVLWIIDNQFGRRNLAEIDRIALARKKEAILRPIAAEARKAGNSRGGQSGKSSAILPTTSKIDTRKEAAKLAGVGERTYDAGKLILDAAANGEIAPETVEKVRRGEAAIHRVAKDIKETRQQSERKEKRARAVKESPIIQFDELIVGDFRKRSDAVPDGSLSLIFTDPPYDRKSIALFDGLAEFSEAKLADGGSLICYVGQIQLAEAIERLGTKLRLWWTLCCLHSGGSNIMREYGIRNEWKPVLWFVKGTRDNKEDIVSDVMSGGREKSHHDWQQAESEAAYWISHLCPDDGIVCDPFLGGGTTAVAARKLGRKWVGFEIDKQQAAIAAQRIGA